MQPNHSRANKFRAITARLDCVQLAQAARFSSVGLTTFICTCRISGATGATAIRTRTTANDNYTSVSEQIRHALKFVSSYTPDD